MELVEREVPEGKPGMNAPFELFSNISISWRVENLLSLVEPFQSLKNLVAMRSNSIATKSVSELGCGEVASTL